MEAFDASSSFSSNGSDCDGDSILCPHIIFWSVFYHVDSGPQSGVVVIFGVLLFFLLSGGFFTACIFFLNGHLLFLLLWLKACDFDSVLLSSIVEFEHLLANVDICIHLLHPIGAKDHVIGDSFGHNCLRDGKLDVSKSDGDISDLSQGLSSGSISYYDAEA